MPVLRSGLSGVRGAAAKAEEQEKPSTLIAAAVVAAVPDTTNNSNKVKVDEKVEVAVAEAEENEAEKEEEDGEKNMDELDSSGRSNDKANAGGENEGSTTPLPEKISVGGLIRKKQQRWNG